MAKVRLLNGKPLMVGGKVALSDDCCCESATCHDCPADNITLTLSGITLCTGFCLTGFNGTYGVNSGSVNGTYVVPKIISPRGSGCCYELVVPNAINMTQYIDPVCIVPAGAFDTNLGILVGRFDSPTDPNGPPCQWKIFVYVEPVSPDDFMLFIGGPQLSFSTPFANTAVCGGGDGGVVYHPCTIFDWQGIAGAGGTATLSA